MFTPTWWYSARWTLRHRQFPPLSRRLKWDAEHLFKQRLRQLSSDDIVIDCGANLGVFTSKFANTGAMVHAFEPDPHCFSILEKKFSGVRNVSLHNQAVGVEPGSITLFRAKDFETDPDKFSVSSSVYASKNSVDSSNSISVEQIDLIDFIKKLPSISLLKVDIEGAEVPLLEKLLDSGVIDKVQQTFVETHDRQIAELAARTDALRARIANEGRNNINLHWR